MSTKDIDPVNYKPPFGKTLLLSTQHVLAFYAGAVVVPLVIAGGLNLTPAQTIHLINADLFTCGIATLIQSVGFWKIGVRLPIIQGVTTTAISPIIAIGLAVTGPDGGAEGLPTIYGSIIVAGLFTFLAAPYFAKIVRFFPPVVIGTVLATMGITLLGVSAGDIINRVDEMQPPQPIAMRSLAYAAGTLLIIILVQRFFRGFLGTISVLLGLVIGTGVAIALGDASFSEVGTSHWLGVTTPFYFGAPRFALSGIISMIIVMIITMVETTGDVFACGEIVGRRITRDHIARALRADGLSTTLGGILNSFPYTCFAQNVGLVRLTGVKSRWVVALAGGLMIILGIIPKAGAVVASIPGPVLGAASLALFANVALVGIQMLSKVDLHDARNSAIVTTSLGLAMLVSFKPDIANVFPSWAQIFFASGVTIGSITAIVLNLVFFHLVKTRGEDVALTKGKRLTLSDVNAMDKTQFVHTFKRLFNDATWPVERAYQSKPFEDVQHLRDAFQEAVLTASRSDQDTLISAYPDMAQLLLSDEGAAQQISQDIGSLALDQMDDKEREEIQELSDRYRKRFAMPFVACLGALTSREQIAKKGLRRLENSPVQERIVVLSEIVEIANDRFSIMLTNANPVRTAWSRKFERLD
ncbi:solute carrier family 23 protein [Gleimia hominis]|uniref:solute carrier family 23 protein n=1 Tax=Gleimia hominis TaxID=595468 RepID=UPI000C801A3E|nr:solute carrier family 23 protein [Gleimia hominis]WIK65043.1 solute carrier family 23 protein [Gleimia hominis]